MWSKCSITVKLADNRFFKAPRLSLLIKTNHNKSAAVRLLSLQPHTFVTPPLWITQQLESEAEKRWRAAEFSSIQTSGLSQQNVFVLSCWFDRLCLGDVHGLEMCQEENYHSLDCMWSCSWQWWIVCFSEWTLNGAGCHECSALEWTQRSILCALWKHFDSAQTKWPRCHTTATWIFSNIKMQNWLNSTSVW